MDAPHGFALAWGRNSIRLIPLSTTVRVWHCFGRGVWHFAFPTCGWYSRTTAWRLSAMPR